MTRLEIEAINAAYPFGGFALPEYKDVIERLESLGLVTIDCTDPIDSSYGYSLTPKGKTYLDK